ncbi:hypothetical protein GH714_002973 [Hevea brasiliensis]|uniref:Leucine-rich repeat-containing N-terminal plant-type domain-containing protein n=1 Tax=Hevea brasiliensis TaxID=3981 RepID=A0A6A6L9X8_HEVBR|nr:hypothetical protein GH714_002973 [Hevea brasiliensis]
MSSFVRALTTFKEAIYEDPLLFLSNWNTLDADPCDWSGVICSFARDHVVKINITKSSIRGFLPPELGRITYLRELAFAPELGNLKYLEELQLDRNRLQGTIPASGNSDFPSNVHGMNVSSTNSTGLCRATQLKVADLSYNFFVGNIPKCLKYLPSTSFQGNCLQIKDPKQRSAALCGGAPPAKTHQTFNPKHQPTEDLSNHHQEASKPSWLLALEIITGTMAGSLFLVAVLTAFRRCNSKSSIIIPWKKSASQNDYAAVYIDSELLKDVVRFSRQDLEVACEDFSNIIGSSPDSLVYKGTIKGGPEIAVISLCIKEEHWTGYLELYFQKEVADLARLNHENTGGLLGYCRESTPFTRMLVFEYASNGTLYEHLHYLNSSAVYLTEDFSPKVVDFESWKSIIARSEKNSGSIGSQGAICVLPNSLDERHLDLQGNAKEFLEMPEVMCYLVDPELKHFEYEDLKIICEVVSLCIHPEPTKRPSQAKQHVGEQN